MLRPDLSMRLGSVLAAVLLVAAVPAPVRADDVAGQLRAPSTGGSHAPRPVPGQGLHVSLDTGLFYGHAGPGDCPFLGGSCGGYEYGAIVFTPTVRLPIGRWSFDAQWPILIASDERIAERQTEGFLSGNPYLGARHPLGASMFWIGGGIGVPLAPGTLEAARPLSLAAFTHGLREVWLYAPGALSLVIRGGLRRRDGNVLLEVPAAAGVLIPTGDVDVGNVAMQIEPRATLLLANDVVRFGLHASTAALLSNDPLGQVSAGTRAALHTGSFYAEARFDLHLLNPAGADVDWLFLLALGADLEPSTVR